MRVCNKQHDRLFPGTRSHSQQMGKRLYETAVQRMVPNNELESEKKLENITIKFVLSSSTAADIPDAFQLAKILFHETKLTDCNSLLTH